MKKTPKKHWLLQRSIFEKCLNGSELMRYRTKIVPLSNCVWRNFWTWQLQRRECELQHPPCRRCATTRPDNSDCIPLTPETFPLKKTQKCPWFSAFFSSSSSFVHKTLNWQTLHCAKRKTKKLQNGQCLPFILRHQNGQTGNVHRYNKIGYPIVWLMGPVTKSAAGTLATAEDSLYSPPSSKQLVCKHKERKMHWTNWFVDLDVRFCVKALTFRFRSWSPFAIVRVTCPWMEDKGRVIWVRAPNSQAHFSHYRDCFMRQDRDPTMGCSFLHEVITATECERKHYSVGVQC